MKYDLGGVTTHRLYFRPITLEDYDAWLPFYQNPKSTEYWLGQAKIPEIACREDLNRSLYRYKHKLGGKYALILRETGQLIGQCGLLLQEVDGIQELEIGYSILPQYWKQGFATEAARACKQYAIDNKLCNSLISIIQVDNIGSQKVALNNGMQIEKTTTYHNNTVYIFRVILTS